MRRTRAPGLGQAIQTSFSDGFAAPVLMLGMLAVLIARGIFLLPNGYNGEGGLNAVLLLLLLIWFMGMLARCQKPASGLAAAIVGFSLYMSLSFFASLAAAASAIGGGDYIDPWLSQADQLLFPFYDWKAVALALPEYRLLYQLLNVSYNSMHWQPLVFLVFAARFGDPKHIGAFATAWGLGLLMCVIPFHWLPAISPIPYYGIGQHDLPGHDTSLPWAFLPVMEGMRDGTITAIGTECVTGIITMPSFHAAGAVILAWAFWQHRPTRWPFMVLNVLMALSAVPIGSHYLVDVVGGSIVGAIAAAGATAMTRRRIERQKERSKCPPGILTA
jgi:membrane-associated phospholipid phosphatase